MTWRFLIRVLKSFAKPGFRWKRRLLLMRHFSHLSLTAFDSVCFCDSAHTWRGWWWWAGWRRRGGGGGVRGRVHCVLPAATTAVLLQYRVVEKRCDLPATTHLSIFYQLPWLSKLWYSTLWWMPNSDGIGIFRSLRFRSKIEESCIKNQQSKKLHVSVSWIRFLRKKACKIVDALASPTFLKQSPLSSIRWCDRKDWERRPVNEGLRRPRDN